MSSYRSSPGEIIRDSIVVLIGVLFISVLTGHRLEEATQLFFVQYPFLIIALPSMISQCGDLSDVFLAHITSKVYLSTVDEHLRPYSEVISDFIGVFLSGSTSFFLLSTIVTVLNFLIFKRNVFFLSIYLVIMLSGLITMTIMSTIGVFLVLYLYKKGLNPDNFTAPITTTGGDFLATLLLVLLSSVLF